MNDKLAHNSKNKKHILYIVFIMIILIFLLSSLIFKKYQKGINIPILMYHHFSNDSSEISDATMKPEKFEQHLDLINEMGYTAISFDDLTKYLDDNIPLPDKPIIITIDDGYKSNYTYAYPALKEKNMKATINIIGCVVGLDIWHDGTPLIPYLSWNELQEMVDSNLIDLGSHTYAMHTHDDFNNRQGVYPKDYESIPEYIDSLNRDFTAFDNETEKNLNLKFDVFAYPYGYHTELSNEKVKEYSFSYSLSTKTGTNYIKKDDTDLYLLKRNNVSGEISIEAFKKLLLSLQ